MELNRLTREADEQIRKVVARYNQLYTSGGAISQVELDLLLDELRKVYDTFKAIGHINQTRILNQKKPEITIPSPSIHSVHTPKAADLEQKEVFSEPETHQGKPNAESHSKSNFQPEVEEDEKTTIEPENPVQHKTEITSASDLKTPEAPEFTEPSPPAQIENEKSFAEITSPQKSAMLADRFNPVNKSLSETIFESAANEVVGARIALHPITDLSTGIGLNDKFSFISDLFSNSAVQYEEAITRINKAVNFDEANWILQKYQTSEWTQKQESLTRLKNFVKRRFI